MGRHFILKWKNFLVKSMEKFKKGKIIVFIYSEQKYLFNASNVWSSNDNVFIHVRII